MIGQSGFHRRGHSQRLMHAAELIPRHEDRDRRFQVRIYTSIITIQEVSVSSFKRNVAANDNHTKVAKLARIQGITKEIALTSAKFEAAILEKADKGAKKDEKVAENRRRKWDCFHLATAVVLGCETLYAFDTKYGTRKTQLGLHVKVRKPEPRIPDLLDLD